MIEVADREEAILRDLLEYRKKVVADIGRLQDRLRAIDQFSESLGVTTENAQVNTRNTLPPQDAGPQEVVEKFLRDSPGVFYRPREIGKAIMERGYKPNTQKLEIWYAQVTNCLRRAERKGVAESQTRDGKKWYGLKEESPTTTDSENQEDAVR